MKNFTFLFKHNNAFIRRSVNNYIRFQELLDGTASAFRTTGDGLEDMGRKVAAKRTDPKCAHEVMTIFWFSIK